MSVSTYLELYLTLFGWHMYSVFWDIIVDTGVAYMPFVGMFLRNIVEPIKSQEAKDASSTSLRRIEMDLFMMFTVIVLAVQPFITLNYNGLNYTKSCSTGTTVNAGSTGTTYDSTFTQARLGGATQRVPIWWYAVLSVTGGFNDAAILGIPCTTDIRLLSFEITNERVKDPQLRRQVQLFNKDCYRSSMATFIDKKLTYPNTLPQEDLYWAGSSYFVGGLYQQKRASTEIPGFRFNPNRDLKYDPNVHVPVDGKPTCAEWWTGQGHTGNVGLRDALKGEITPAHLTNFMAALGGNGNSTAQNEDIAIKTLLSREKTNFNGLRNLNTYNDASLGNVYNSAAGTIGGLFESLSFYPAIYMMKTAAPVIQATVLMLIYMLMPFYFVFSSYNIGKMIFLSIILFSIKFWTVLWAVAHWLDNNLLDALKPTWFNLYDAFSQNNYVVTLVVDFVIAGLFVVVPLFWSGLLTWAGHIVGSEITKGSDKMGDGAKSGGKAGGGLGKSALKSGVKKL